MSYREFVMPYEMKSQPDFWAKRYNEVMTRNLERHDEAVSMQKEINALTNAWSEYVAGPQAEQAEELEARDNTLIELARTHAHEIATYEDNARTLRAAIQSREDEIQHLQELNAEMYRNLRNAVQRAEYQAQLAEMVSARANACGRILKRLRDAQLGREHAVEDPMHRIMCDVRQMLHVFACDDNGMALALINGER